MGRAMARDGPEARWGPDGLVTARRWPSFSSPVESVMAGDRLPPQHPTGRGPATLVALRYARVVVFPGWTGRVGAAVLPAPPRALRPPHDAVAAVEAVGCG